MGTPKVFESEYRFCLILWENEPINSTKLARLCNERLGWSRTTTYTVIKRLSERGVVKNENAIVTSLVSKDEVQAAEIEELMEKTFEGSIPAFIAAFTKRRRLSRAHASCLMPLSYQNIPAAQQKKFTNYTVNAKYPAFGLNASSSVPSAQSPPYWCCCPCCISGDSGRLPALSCYFWPSALLWLP